MIGVRPPSEIIELKLNDVYLHAGEKTREYNGLRLLNNIAGLLSLQDSLHEKAAKIFSLHHQHLSNELKLAEIVTGAIYLASRLLKVPLRLADLLQACVDSGIRIVSKDIIKAASLIRRKMGKVEFHVTRPFDYL